MQLEGCHFSLFPFYQACQIFAVQKNCQLFDDFANIYLNLLHLLQLLITVFKMIIEMFKLKFCLLAISQMRKWKIPKIFSTKQNVLEIEKCIQIYKLIFSYV